MNDYDLVKKGAKVVEYLAKRGIHPAHVSGKWHYYYKDFLDGMRHDGYGFAVDNETNIWLDRPNDEHGTVIDLVLKMEGKFPYHTKADERAALVALANEFGITLNNNKTFKVPAPSAPVNAAPLAPIVPRPTVAPVAPAAPSAEQKEEEPETPKMQRKTCISLKSKYTKPALLRYIESRGISIDIAANYCVDIAYFYTNNPQRIFHGVGLKNRIGGYAVRNNLDLYASKLNLGHQDITVIPIANTGRYFVFEGMFDFLSILELNKMSGTKNDFDVIVLNTVNNWKKAWNVLDGAKDIAIMLDNDDKPKNAADITTAKLLERYPNAIDNRQPLREYGVKDWNDLLKKIKGII